MLGIRVLLKVGVTVPRPAPVELLTSLSRLEVTADAALGDGFQMTFSIGRTSRGNFALLESDLLAAGSRVLMGVVFGAVPEALFDGVITHTQFGPVAGSATLTVTGKDLSALMDMEERNQSFENQPDSVIAGRALGRYASDGVVPAVTATTEVPSSMERVPSQQETDLKLLQRLAARNSFVFFVEPIALGATRGYWGPDLPQGPPQSALTFGEGSSGNVRTITFSDDALAPVGTGGTIVEPITRMAIPIPSLPSLREPPLAAQVAPARRTTLQRATANLQPATAAARALAETANAADAVTAEGELDGVRYGHALRARRLVGVRGVGLPHDGLWRVRKVTHTISRGEYVQRFTLGREGRGSLTPVVRP